MNKTVSVEGDATFHAVMSDLGLDFAHSPVHRIGFEINDRGITLLTERYREHVFRTRQRQVEGKLTWRHLLLRFEKNVYVVALGDGTNFGEIVAPSVEAASNLHRELQEVLKRDARGETAFYMLRYDYNEFEAHPIDNVPEPVDDDLLQLCYGKDIVAWIGGFLQSTTERSGGLTIFEGPPGTGKTTLIMQMLRRLAKTHVFYVLPVARDGALSSPELVPFWQRENVRHADRVKVIVMEDAERLLWRREGDNREAVSSLLNIADGLMGRMLRLHVICSVNARMEDLDPAILRPGRLTNHRRFNLLSRAVAEEIAQKKKVAFRARTGVAEYSLADVLNPGVKLRQNEKRRIGFKTPITA